MLFALIDAGRFIGTRTMLSQAAAAGARAACVSSTVSAADVTTAVNDAAPVLGGMMTVTVSCSGACTYPVATGASVEVQVQYNFVAGFYKAFQTTMSNRSLVTC